MWGEQCPVHAEIRLGLKITMEELHVSIGKSVVISQVFVTQSEHLEERPENPLDAL